jgi:hypothetical protein
VLGVGDGVSDDVYTNRQHRSKAAGQPSTQMRRKRKRGTGLTLKEDLEDAASLLVDQSRDPLNTSSSSESSDGGLGDTLAAAPHTRGKGKAKGEVA